MDYKVYDQEGHLLDDYDLEKGYLKSSTKTVHHDAIEGVEEQGHYDTVREYSNGGKDVKWVVDVPAVAAREAWDEQVIVSVYVPYTEEELSAMVARKRISELKTKLFETDYAVIKIAEGAADKDEYADIIAQRQVWRAEINKLEAMGGVMDAR